MSQTIEQDIFEVVKSLNPNKKISFDADTDLFATGILDSFGMIEYIGHIEEKFGIAIPNDALIPQNFWSVRAAADLVRKYNA